MRKCSTLIKVSTLTSIAIGAQGCAHQIVRELETISTWDRPVLAAAAVKALGSIACKSDLAQLCLPKLLYLLNDPRELVSGKFYLRYTKFCPFSLGCPIFGLARVPVEHKIRKKYNMLSTEQFYVRLEDPKIFKI